MAHKLDFISQCINLQKQSKTQTLPMCI